MNATHDTIGPAMRAAAEDIAQEYMDVFSPDVRNLMGFYASLRKLLVECGVHDFSFQDLQKPTHERLSKIFSYIINFVRFRESQTGVIDKHFNLAETSKARIETLCMENQDMEARLEEMKRRKSEMEHRAKEKVARNQELKQRLRALQGSQTEVMARYEGLQRRKDELSEQLREREAATMHARAEAQKLRPYTQLSPQVLQGQLTDLGNTLSSDKLQIDTLDRRSRALQTSTDTFSVVTSDLSGILKTLTEISDELSKEEDENAKSAKQRDALSERSNNVREVEREEEMLKRQLGKYEERIEKVKRQDAEKQESARSKMEELRQVHRGLTEERGEKGREVERRRVRIEQTEKKVCYGTLMRGFVGMRLTNGRCRI